jgi:hypothetical protein
MVAREMLYARCLFPKTITPAPSAVDARVNVVVRTAHIIQTFNAQSQRDGTRPHYLI